MPAAPRAPLAAAVAARLPVALLLLALATPLSGCITCDPRLDVHHCRTETGRCDPAGEVVADWESDPSHMALFPGIDELVRSLGPGEHGHRAWSDERAQAFWAFYQVPEDRPDKQVFLRSEGNLFHVRVLAC
jgi:hypothetical protein